MSTENTQKEPKRLIDENAKVFGKINIIDLLLLIAVVVLGALLGARALKPSDSSGVVVQRSGEYTMKFYVEEVESFTANGMDIGDDLFDDSKNLPLGTITHIQRDDSIDFNPDTNGVLVKSSKEGYNSMEITTNLTAQPWDHGLIVSGNKYGVGQSLTIRAGQSVIFLRISGIEER